MRKALFFMVLMIFSAAPISAFAGKVYHLPPERLVEYIDKKAGQRHAIMVFASWCPHCRQKMPQLIDIEQRLSRSVLPVSIDVDNAKFARYIDTLNPEPNMMILNKGTQQDLLAQLNTYGVKRWQGIPYIILFDEKSNVVHQGNLKAGFVESFLAGE